jgi:hypothetical protein
MDCGGRLRAMSDATGQALVVTVVFLVVLLGMAGFAIDVGHAYLVQRQLQAGVDAAALAAAQELPDTSRAIAAANAYGPTPGASKPNQVTTVDNAVTSATTRCVELVPGRRPRCSGTPAPVNAIRVTAESVVPTFFAKIVGRDSFTVHASATACSPCSPKPLDIMLVLDRTGSMCQVGNGQDDHPQCHDLANAKQGINTFLGYMDPSLDKVGLAVFPPAYNDQSLCTTPTNGQKRYGYDTWWPHWIPGPADQTPGIYAIASLTDDYLTETGGTWGLNPGSPLNLMIECTQSAGTTSYANAIEEAQHELDDHGRGDVQDVIVFLSDGAANTTPRHVPSYLDNVNDRAHPCGAGVKAAARAKARGTVVYSIGYDLNGLGTDYERCRTVNPDGSMGAADSLTAYDAIGQIATDKEHFYLKPDPGQLNTIFTSIAADISRPASRLIDDNVP